MEGVKKSDMERIGLAPHPWPLSPDGARGKNILQLTPSPPSGERGERLISVHKRRRSRRAGEGVVRSFFTPSGVVGKNWEGEPPGEPSPQQVIAPSGSAGASPSRSRPL